VAEGLLARSQGDTTGAEAEPMPDWERELLSASEQTEATDAQAAELKEEVEGAVESDATQAADEVVADADAAEVALEEAPAEPVSPEVAEEIADATN
jgi:small subunit ribosomal protein S2